MACATNDFKYSLVKLVDFTKYKACVNAQYERIEFLSAVTDFFQILMSNLKG